MNGALYDSVHNVFFELRYEKLYDAMLATSLGPVDVALGKIGWALLRGGLYSVAFVIVMAAMGLLDSWWALLAVPAALLIALGFGAVGMAVASFLTTFQQLDSVNTAILPMFLFSTTFYPLDVYPRGIQIVVECLPLYQGIELMRGLTLGVVGLGLLVPGGLPGAHGRPARGGPPGLSPAARPDPRPTCHPPPRSGNPSPVHDHQHPSVAMRNCGPGYAGGRSLGRRGCCGNRAAPGSSTWAPRM